MGESLAESRIGQIRENNFGSIMEVVEYKNNADIWVKFEQGKPVHTKWQNFNNGSVRNLYDRSVFGIGYIGEGTYKVIDNGKRTYQYKIWHSMLNRCYDEKLHERRPTYLGCYVCEEWHNFQTFAAWCDDNFYEFEEEKMNLDKDILYKGNKIYSPEKCVFVPQNINKLFTKRDSKRGELPIGVHFDKENQKYMASCSNGFGKLINLSRFNIPEDAFNTYKSFKEQLIKQIAEEYKGKIPTKLYNAMINYEVEIND